MATALRECGGRGRTCGRVSHAPREGARAAPPNPAHHHSRTYPNPDPPPRNARPKKYIPAEPTSHTVEPRNRGKKRKRDFASFPGALTLLRDYNSQWPSRHAGARGLAWCNLGREDSAWWFSDHQACCRRLSLLTDTQPTHSPKESESQGEEFTFLKRACDSNELLRFGTRLWANLALVILWVQIPAPQLVRVNLGKFPNLSECFSHPKL